MNKKIVICGYCNLLYTYLLTCIIFPCRTKWQFLFAKIQTYRKSVPSTCYFFRISFRNAIVLIYSLRRRVTFWNMHMGILRQWQWELQIFNIKCSHWWLLQARNAATLHIYIALFYTYMHAWTIKVLFKKLVNNVNTVEYGVNCYSYSLINRNLSSFRGKCTDLIDRRQGLISLLSIIRQTSADSVSYESADRVAE